MKIESIEAFQIFDSRGNPTVEVDITLENGVTGRGLVPSGASTGQYEALELRDGTSRFRGKFVFQALANVHTEIAPLLKGRDVYDQEQLDHLMIDLDGTRNKRRLGANAILGVSMAAARAAAISQGKALYDYLGGGKGYLLPLPEIQIIGGGAHADWRIDIQDFMLVAVGAENYSQALEMTFNVYHATGDILKELRLYAGIADEGGYWPELRTNAEGFDLLMHAIERAGYQPGTDVAISLDIAASDLYDPDGGVYRFRLEDKTFTSDEFAELMVSWCDTYPIIAIEDPMADTDWNGWKRIFNALGRKIQVIGDDLFTTSIHRIQNGIEREVANAVLIKLNQIGTVTETLEAIRVTQEAGWLAVVSARSGETEDAFISHLSVATNSGQLKVGAFARGERTAKWNDVLRIERALGSRARFEGGRIYERILDR